MLKLIFCNDFLEPKKVDPDFEEEYLQARKAGFDCLLVSHEELTDDAPIKSIGRLQAQETKTIGIYRGWMLTPEQYSSFYESLANKNIHLINSPEEYSHTHYLPNSYSLIQDRTPTTVFLPISGQADFANINKLLTKFGTSPIMVKDYVKSEKHYWTEACFIPDASDKEKVKAVTERFLELRGSSLNKGLVYREFIELEFLTDHSKSGMPLTKEFRLFWLNGEILSSFKYWDEGDYQDVVPPISEFEGIAKAIKSNFFSMDVAKERNGSWTIIELGDGQVSGLPDNADKSQFYEKIKINFA